MGSVSLRRLVLVLSVLGIAIAAILAGRVAAGPPPAAKAIDPAPFPTGFDYPQPGPTVRGWAINREGGRMRQHGWSLFAGLNQETADGELIWRTWYTSTQAFPWQYARSGSEAQTGPITLIERNRHNSLSHRGNPGLTAPGAPVYPVPERVQSRYPGCVLKKPSALPVLKDGPTFQSNGDVMIAGVVYDSSAFEWIQDNRLYDARVLSSQLPATRTDPATAITDFPDTAIVLKPMWWPVQGTGFTALPVWDSPLPSADGSLTPKGARYAGFEVQRLWTRAVAVTTDPAPSQTTATVTFLHEILDAKGNRQLPSNTYANAPVVPIERFYHLSFSADDLAAMDRCDRALLDASAIWNYGRPFAAGDALVLIAMHVMTHERPGWTFQTLWWHDKALGCSTAPGSCSGGEGSTSLLRFGSARPNLPGNTTWWNYFLVTTYGEAQQPGNNNEWPPNLPLNAKKWPVAYNPYIELAATHPIATNCRNCHHRAAWPPRPPAGGKLPSRFSSYLAGGANVPDALDVFEMDDHIFDGLLTVDSMWAVTDRAHNPPEK